MAYGSYIDAAPQSKHLFVDSELQGQSFEFGVRGGENAKSWPHSS